MTLWAWLDAIPIAVYALVAVAVLLSVEVLALRQDLRRLREWRAEQHRARMQDLDRIAELDDMYTMAHALLLRYTSIHEPPDSWTHDHLAAYLRKTHTMIEGEHNDQAKIVGLDGRAL
jgi:hypothetical protein